MAVVEMKRLCAVVLRRKQAPLIRRLMRLRCVEITAQQQDAAQRRGDADEEKSRIKAAIAETDAALALLHRRSQSKETVAQEWRTLDTDRYENSAALPFAEGLVKRVSALMRQEDACKAEIVSQNEAIFSYAPFLFCDVPLDFTGTKDTFFTFGTLPAIGGETADGTLTGLPAVLSLYEKQGTSLFCSLLVHKSKKEEALAALQKIGFQPISFPHVAYPAAVCTANAKEEIAALETRLASLWEESVRLAKDYPALEVYSDYLHTSLSELDALSRLGETQATATLDAWVPAAEEARVRAALEKEGCAYSFSNPTDGDVPPVLLRNPSFFAPFEDVMAMYSLPAYGTFDPTVIMAVFYFIIFGMMLADVGYGLLLIFGGLLLRRALHAKGGMRRLITLFVICGCSCVLFGVLMGGYFGNLPAAFLKNVLSVTAVDGVPIEQWSPALWFDPMQTTTVFGMEIGGTILFLVLSLLLGVLHILCGMLIEMCVLFRQGKWFEAVFDVGSWVLVFLGAGLYFLSSVAGIVAVVAGLLMIVCTHGRHAKNLPMKILGGFLGLYSFVSYASDVLSYARILALGLASCVIAQVINMASGMMASGILGVLFFIILFAVGHIANLLINLLGTYVHASRLQYIEFFGKFFTDGGVAFSPLLSTNTYTTPYAE